LGGFRRLIQIVFGLSIAFAASSFFLSFFQFAGGALVCFAVMSARPSFSILDATDFALFFLYVTLNLTWVCLRSISIAVDEYVFYEKLELARRVGNMATILAMLIGLPFTASWSARTRSGQFWWEQQRRDY